ncbi:unnamed protein product [Fraxinus pennsylvanica]|uniref:NAD(P)-binding domain-containing protein n=1 Tax=Fraxinus pennsylvanica TaxID=56036 RepID=A0AAD2DPW9_9LAMI|nr:unnamed protein product [Fraxinus pennsylvanica]
MEFHCFCSVTKPPPSSSSSTILNFQGISSVGRKYSGKTSDTQVLSSSFLQRKEKFQPFVYKQSSSYSLRTYRGSILSEAGKQGWDLGRFVKTLYFFNGPPSPAKFFEFLIEKLSGSSPSEAVKSMDTSGIILVAGATGGVGRRVVDLLRKKGLPVRVLVRNEEKARKMLGPDVDLVSWVHFQTLMFIQEVMFVHVSSAGVTRPERPGLDLSKQPPAVRLNKELGFILTFKLKGEDVLRESGVPYTIIRPCALTEEPAGAELIFDQGDNITGKISREEVARICIAALESPYACYKTFEVKSVIPFNSEGWHYRERKLRTNPCSHLKQQSTISLDTKFPACSYLIKYFSM